MILAPWAKDTGRRRRTAQARHFPGRATCVRACGPAKSRTLIGCLHALFKLTGAGPLLLTATHPLRWNFRKVQERYCVFWYPWSLTLYHFSTRTYLTLYDWYIPFRALHLPTPRLPQVDKWKCALWTLFLTHHGFSFAARKSLWRQGRTPDRTDRQGPRDARNRVLPSERLLHRLSSERRTLTRCSPRDWSSPNPDDTQRSLPRSRRSHPRR